ncbi:MAG: hypothetical protein AAFO73_12630, partial [Pseudomonadota bacterium]
MQDHLPNAPNSPESEEGHHRGVSEGEGAHADTFTDTFADTLDLERARDAQALLIAARPSRLKLGASVVGRLVRRFAKILLIAVLVWITAIVALVGVYAVDGVRPISTLMLADFARGKLV